MAFNLTAGNPVAHRVRVYYEGSSTIYEGMPVCYNYDSTTNWFGGSVTLTQGATTGEVTATNTTAEGSQNEGKYIRVENPATANLQWLAGYVAQGGWCGKTGPRALDIFIPNGAIIPVRIYATAVVGVTELGLQNAVQYLTPYTGSGSQAVCALAMETVDRATTAGICLCKVFNTGQVISGSSMLLNPYRYVGTGDAYGVRIVGDSFFTETGTSSRGWLVGISGDKETAGGNDSAGLRININNYAVNANTYNFRGLNCAVKNHTDGVVGELSNTISTATDTDSDGVTTMITLKLDAEHLGAGNPTEYGGLDIACCREGGAATTEYGIQIRTRGTINTAINTAIRLTKDATDHGFINLFNIETDAVDVLACTGDTAHDTSDIAIPIVFNGATYYIVAQDSRG